MMNVVTLCLAAGFATGICHTLTPGEFSQPVLPPLPDWTTQRWIHNAAGIVAGETAPYCDLCDLWIACTIAEDVTRRGYHPWHLRSDRWHGWKQPSERHLAVMERALTAGGCDSVPVCAFLGSFSDYTGNWRFDLAHERQVFAIGNRHGAIVCIPGDDN